MVFPSADVYATVYNTTTTNTNSENILLDDEQLEERPIDTELVKKDGNLYKTYDLEDNKEYNQFVEKTNEFIVDRYSKKTKPTRIDPDQTKRKNEAFTKQTTNKEQQLKPNFNERSFL